MPDLRVSALAIYPVKSTRGIPLGEAALTWRGLRHDRRWMVVDSNGSFLTQRTFPRMALIESLIRGESMVLHAPDAAALVLPVVPARGAARRVVVWKDTCDAVYGGDEAADWFTRLLGTKCELVGMPDASERRVNPEHAAPGDLVSFADGYPLLLTSVPSLDALSTRVGAPVAMERFRPNLVVDGCDADEEDTWKRIAVGDVLFRVAKACERCSIPTIDPWTLEKGTEPLKTLATYRRRNNAVLFGQNLIPDTLGTVRVGDPVRVLESTR